LAGFGQFVALSSSLPGLSYDPVLLEGAQPRGEDVGSDAAEAGQQLGVAARAEEQVAHDQERPSLADHVERCTNGTKRLVRERRRHLTGVYRFDLDDPS